MPADRVRVMAIRFYITIYGTNEHAERNIAQKLWDALEKEHAQHEGVCAMLIGEAEYELREPSQKVKG